MSNLSTEELQAELQGLLIAVLARMGQISESSLMPFSAAITDHDRGIVQTPRVPAP